MDAVTDAALALSVEERQALAVAFADNRDRAVRNGNHERAKFYNECLCAIEHAKDFIRQIDLAI